MILWNGYLPRWPFAVPAPEWLREQDDAEQRPDYSGVHKPCLLSDFKTAATAAHFTPERGHFQ
jgi:hypothetical protein